MRKQNILITGATSGIGEAIARKCISPNTTLIITGRTANTLIKLKEYIEKLGGVCRPYTLDLSDMEAVSLFGKQIKNDFSTIDWIIHSAGHIEEDVVPFHESSIVIQKTFAVNTLSIMNIMGSLMEIISESGGSIILSSTAGIWGNAQHPLYATSKGAVLNFAKSLAHLWTNSTRRSIAICPGPTNTPMRERVAHDANMQQSPEEVAQVLETIIFNSDTYKNGTVLVIRNGKTSVLNE